MPAEYGNLNGSGNQRVYLSVDDVAQNTGGNNATTFRIVVQFDPNGSGHWTSDPGQSWSAAAGPFSSSGNFSIPSPVRMTLLDTTFNRAHAANGTSSSFNATASINTNHASIGDGSVSFTVPAPPRIPKAPEAPTIIGVDQITATSFRIRFSGNDNGGSSILEWEADVDESGSSFPSPVRKNNLTGTDVISGSPLTPGDTVWIRVRGRNAIGDGDWSATTPVALEATAPGTAGMSPTGVAVPPDQITLDWNAPTSNGGKAITGYDVAASKSSTFSSGVTSSSTGSGTTIYTFSGLDAGGNYYLRVRAKNVDATGAWVVIGPVQIPAGGKVWNGSTWKTSLWKVWTGSLWKIALVKVWTGSVWKVSK